MNVELLNAEGVVNLGEEVNVNIKLERDHEEETLTPVHSSYFPNVSYYI